MSDNKPRHCVRGYWCEELWSEIRPTPYGTPGFYRTQSLESQHGLIKLKNAVVWVKRRGGVRILKCCPFCGHYIHPMEKFVRVALNNGTLVLPQELAGRLKLECDQIMYGGRVPLDERELSLKMIAGMVD